MSDKQLIDTEMAAHAFAGLLQPTTVTGLKRFLEIGRERYRDMSRFDEYYLCGSIHKFSSYFIAPMIIADLRRALKKAKKSTSARPTLRIAEDHPSSCTCEDCWNDIMKWLENEDS